MFVCSHCRRGLRVDFSVGINEETLSEIRRNFNALRSQNSNYSKNNNQNNIYNNSDSASASSSSSSSSSSSPLTNPNSSNVSNQLQLLSDPFEGISESFIVVNSKTSATSSSSSSASSSSPSPSSSNASAPPSSSSSSSFDRQLSSVSTLFEQLSSCLPMDFPLCSLCSDFISMDLDKKVKENQSEIQKFKNEIHKLTSKSSSSSPSPSVPSNSHLIIQDFQSIQQDLESKLHDIRLQRSELSVSFSLLSEEFLAFESFESDFWQNYQRDSLIHKEKSEDQNHLQREIQFYNNLLQKLKRTSVIDDVFHISYDGHFGTINGFRLGRLPHQNVEWAETNAALGQSIMLMHTIAKQIHFTFTKFRLIPMGSFSKVCRVDDLSTTYELFGSNDLLLGKLFWYRRFDTALLGMLSCIRELGDFAQLTDPKFKVKYVIKGDTIGECSIKLQFNNEAKWTKALKYFLTNLKLLLVWAQKRRE